MSQKTIQIIVAAIIIIIAFFGFKAFFAGNQDSDTALVAEKAAAGEFIDGQTILALLNNLNKVVLDDSIFTEKVFTSLVNFERPIAEQVAGRPNPFLPIGVDGSGIIIPKSTSTSKAR